MNRGLSRADRLRFGRRVHDGHARDDDACSSQYTLLTVRPSSYGRDIPAAVKYARNPDRLGGMIVNNQIRKYLPKFHRLIGQIRAKMSSTRHAREQTERCDNAAHHMTNNCNPGFIQKVCLDVIEVLLCFRRKNVARHLCPCRSSAANSASIWAKKASPSVPLPSRSDCMPWAIFSRTAVR